MSPPGQEDVSTETWCTLSSYSGPDGEMHQRIATLHRHGPAPALIWAGLTVPADDGVEGASPDGLEDLRNQAERRVGGAVPGGPVAVDRELEGGFHLGPSKAIHYTRRR